MGPQPSCQESVPEPLWRRVGMSGFNLAVVSGSEPAGGKGWSVGGARKCSGWHVIGRRLGRGGAAL